MAKFFGLKPNSKAQRTADDFENHVIIRLNNRRLLGNVYADINDDEWAVSIAYNLVMNPGLWGKENDLEIKYAYQPNADPVVTRLETGSGEEKPISADAFHNPNEFVIWALNTERSIINPA